MADPPNPIGGGTTGQAADGDKYRVLRLNFHLPSDSQTIKISISNPQKLKNNGDFFEMTFYQEQAPAPVPPRPETPPPVLPHLDLDNFKEEMMAIMERMTARVIRNIREQVAEEVAHAGQRMEGELRDLDERLGALETLAGPKRPQLEILRPEEIKKERN